MYFKRRGFYFTILLVAFLFLINIGEINSFPSDPIPQIHSEDIYFGEYQFILEERTSLIIQLRDRLRKLNNIVEEYGNLLTGNEKKVVNLGEEVKGSWEELKELSARSVEFLYDKGKISEEQRQEGLRQEETVEELKDYVFATLFNAKLRKCKSENEAFYEPLSKCFKIGESPPDDPCPSNEWFYELVETNQGVCDCKDEVGFVFHNQSGECYQLNTQGPCETGDWLSLRDTPGSDATCEPVPDKECKLDGSQVYYNGQCQTLGPNSVCNGWGTLERHPGNWGWIKCSLMNVGASFASDVPLFFCPQGSKKARNNQCRLIYKHGVRKPKKNL